MPRAIEAEHFTGLSSSYHQTGSVKAE